MSVTKEVNVRAPSFFVMQTTTPCWKCKAHTAVVGIALPSSFELFEYESEAAKSRSEWLAQGVPAIVFWIEYLPPNVVTHIQRIHSGYRNDYSQTVKQRYWMNHCQHCDVKMGDNYLYNEGSPPYGRMSPNDIAAIRFARIKESFVARVDHFGTCEELLPITG